MNVQVHEPATGSINLLARTAGTPMFADPLDPDEPSDEIVVTTLRAISRVALVASETAARFHREPANLDPMAWMLSPRRMFEGLTPLEACLDRGNCMRGLLVHGLSLGLDFDAAEVDLLLQDGDDEEPDLPTRPPPSGMRPDNITRRSTSRARLWTATIAYTGGNIMLQAFHASIARDPEDVAERLRLRFGAHIAARADIRLGFHPASPLTMALVPDAVADAIRKVERDLRKPANLGFAVDIEQRIEA